MIGVAIMIGSIIICLIILALFFKDNNPFLHILFLFSSMLIFTLGINMINRVIEIDSSNINIKPVFFISLILIIITFIFYIIKYIISILDDIKKENIAGGLEG
jgi:hypothetical protein